MKLSEAMMLGSVTCKMQFGDWNSCGLGAAANALGMPRASNGPFDLDDARLAPMFAYWPWIAPAELDRYKGVPAGAQYFGGDIASRFDREVVSGMMTFEQLVDYVASIEPACGDCNQFTCTCAKPAAVVNSEKLVEAR